MAVSITGVACIRLSYQWLASLLSLVLARWSGLNHCIFEHSFLSSINAQGSVVGTPRSDLVCLYCICIMQQLGPPPAPRATFALQSVMMVRRIYPKELGRRGKSAWVPLAPSELSV